MVFLVTASFMVFISTQMITQSSGGPLRADSEDRNQNDNIPTSFTQTSPDIYIYTGFQPMLMSPPLFYVLNLIQCSATGKEPVITNA